MDKKPENPTLGKDDRKRPPRQLAVIDQKGCTGCHACIPLCPVDCIEQVPGVDHPDFMRFVEVDLERCIGCTICSQFCPWETIYMFPYEEGENQAKALTLRSIIYEGVGEAVPATSSRQT